SRDAVADRAGLAGDAAACNAADNVELLVGLGEDERLTDDGLQGVKAEVIVDVAVVDRDLARALVNSYARNGALSSAGAVEIRCLIVHVRLPPIKVPRQPASAQRACARCLHRRGVSLRLLCRSCWTGSC